MEKQPKPYELIVATQLALLGVLAVSTLNFSTMQKRKIRERQNYTCAEDGCEVQDLSLQIHHRVPLSKGGDDVVENGVGLCKDHHKVYDELALKEKMIFPNIPFTEAPRNLYRRLYQRSR